MIIIIIINNQTDPESNMLIKLNEFIQSESKQFKYHMNHIKLVKKYALLLNRKLNTHLSSHKLSFIALAHDLFKERGLDKSKDDTIFWNNHNIPQDLNKYVRSNLHVLEKFNLDDYFNTDVQLHALAAGIFVHTELGIDDPEILYPIMFHSCPIISVYETLDSKIRNSVDIIMLSDKLSSNYLRINFKGTPVRVDLDLALFGSNGQEFNYTTGLFLARLISQGSSKEEQSVIATDYYYKRLQSVNPIISKNYSIKKLGRNTIWPRRKSQVWKTR